MANDGKNGGGGGNGNSNGAALQKAAIRSILDAFRSKPVQAVSTLVACLFVLSLGFYAVYFVVDTYLDIKERLAESETKLGATETKLVKTEKELEEKKTLVEETDEELEEVKGATEDATAIQAARLETLELEIYRLRRDIRSLKGKKSTPFGDLIGDTSTDLRERILEANAPVPRSDLVRPDGVVQFKK